MSDVTVHLSPRVSTFSKMEVTRKAAEIGISFDWNRIVVHTYVVEARLILLLNGFGTQ